ncbi:hypothetical protein [Bartonella sp. B39]
MKKADVLLIKPLDARAGATLGAANRMTVPICNPSSCKNTC